MDIEKIVQEIRRGVRPDDSGTDIVELILEDHRVLKECISKMKDAEAPEAERREAAETFAIHLVAHAKPEERTLYEAMKTMSELKLDAFEGETEHQLADQLLEEIKRTEDKVAWSAKVKVIAELVEHHIKEEEQDILPSVTDVMPESKRRAVGAAFLEEKAKMFEMGGDDAPPEKSIH